MAITRRFGRNTGLTMGEQDSYTTPVSDYSSMLQRTFPTASLAIVLTGDQTSLVNLQRLSSEALNILGKLGATADISANVSTEDLPYYLAGIMNPTTKPTGSLINVGAGATAAAAGSASKTAAPTADASGNKFVSTPSRVKIAGGTAGAKVEVRGKVKQGVPQDETYSFTEEITLDTSGNGETTYWFTELESLPTGTTATWNSATYDTTTMFNNTGLIWPGWTLGAVIGNKPIAGNGYIPNTTEISVSDTIQITMNLLGRRSNEGRLITDLSTEILKYPEESGDPGYVAAAELSNFPVETSDYVAPWGVAIQFDDEDDFTASEDFTLNINNNLERPRGNDGSRYFGQPILNDTGFVQVTSSASILVEEGDESSDDFKRWEELYISNRTFKLTVYMYNYSDKGQETCIVYTMPRCQLTAVPGMNAESPGALNRNLEFKCVSTAGAANPDQLSVRVCSRENHRSSS